MAMMMTGRVLLVCALCVLWCGVAAANGGAVAQMESEEGSEHLPSGIQDGNGRGHQESEDSVQQESEAANESLDAGKGKSSKKQDVAVPTQPINSGRTVVETQTEKSKSKEEKGSKETMEDIVTPKQDGKITELTSTPEEDRKPAPPPAERVQTQEETPPGVTSPAQNGSSAGILTATPGEAMIIPEGNSDQPQGGKNPANGLATAMPSTKKGEAPEALPSPPTTKNENPEGESTVTRNTEKPSPEVIVSVQKTEILLDDEEVTSNQQNEGLASTTGNQEGEQSDVHAESTPTSISAASNAANDDADTDTDKRIPNNGSAAGGAATEERHQYENKEERAEEKTPLKSAAMINEKTTVGDSDGSTAISHTTSPLLLLLVAFAAAAAVVAA
ncbi:Mucin-associated surface protein (MASP), subgroup S029 [Trypanosoma cruzi]|nr:Mucin-associated surface protein (MASP), subgroup S029 [Trypanosoma cruzi]